MIISEEDREVIKGALDELTKSAKDELDDCRTYEGMNFNALAVIVNALHWKATAIWFLPEDAESAKAAKRVLDKLVTSRRRGKGS